MTRQARPPANRATRRDVDDMFGHPVPMADPRSPDPHVDSPAVPPLSDRAVDSARRALDHVGLSVVRR